MIRSRLTASAVAFAVVASAAVLSTSAAGTAAAAGTAGPIVFVRYTDDGVLEDLYGVPVAGGTPTRLTNSPAVSERGPAWSPDGGGLALLRYGSTHAGPVDGLWVTGPTGAFPTALPGTNDGADPAWSPDGRRIAFSLPFRGHRRIYTTGADGTGLTRLTYSAADDGTPSWSPDGSSLVFSRQDGAGHSSLVKIALATLAETALTPAGPPQDVSPDWSRGNDIVFSRAASAASTSHLFVIHADGTGLHQITASSLNDRSPSWSPDGRRLVFTRGGSDDLDPENLVTSFADGSGQTQITTGAVHDIDADWGPDQQQP